jgi:hypothetical protein
VMREPIQIDVCVIIHNQDIVWEFRLFSTAIESSNFPYSMTGSFLATQPTWGFGRQIIAMGKYICLLRHHTEMKQKTTVLLWLLTDRYFCARARQL